MIGKLLDRFDSAGCFLELDLMSAYHLIKIKKIDKCKTAFGVYYSHFEYQVISFGMSNATASFERFINKLFANKVDIFIMVYLNNIIIYTKNPVQNHINILYYIQNSDGNTAFLPT